MYRAASDECGCNGASTGTNSKGLWVRDARVHRKVDHSYMSAGRSGIMTSEHGHGSQLTGTAHQVVTADRPSMHSILNNQVSYLLARL